MKGSKHYVDYLMHRNVNTSHKYIAKIGEGVNARYFYTLEALNAYKKALSGQDEKANLQQVRNSPDVKKHEYKFDDGTSSTSYSGTNRAAQAKLDKATQDYNDSRTIKGRMEDVKEAHQQVKQQKALRNVVEDPKGQVEKQVKTAGKKVSKEASKVSKDADRIADDAKYAAKDKAIKAETAAKMAKNAAKYGKDDLSVQYEQKKGQVRTTMNDVMRSLNNVGNGRLDDHVEKTIKKGRKIVDRLAGRR